MIFPIMKPFAVLFLESLTLIIIIEKVAECTVFKNGVLTNKKFIFFGKSTKRLCLRCAKHLAKHLGWSATIIY